jgi:hypothetical protein
MPGQVQLSAEHDAMNQLGKYSHLIKVTPLPPSNCSDDELLPFFSPLLCFLARSGISP